MDTLAKAIVLSAVIPAGEGSIDNFAQRESDAAMTAPIEQGVRLPVGVAKDNEVLIQNARGERLETQLR